MCTECSPERCGIACRGLAVAPAAVGSGRMQGSAERVAVHASIQWRFTCNMYFS